MKSKFKVLFMPGMHAATCDRVVIFKLNKLGLSCAKLRAKFSWITIHLEKPPSRHG